jgi:hypothetical protein
LGPIWPEEIGRGGTKENGSRNAFCELLCMRHVGDVALSVQADEERKIIAHVY